MLFPLFQTSAKEMCVVFKVMCSRQTHTQRQQYQYAEKPVVLGAINCLSGIFLYFLKNTHISLTELFESVWF